MARFEAEFCERENREQPAREFLLSPDKKTQKTPPLEIEKVKKYRPDYMRRRREATSRPRRIPSHRKM